MQVRLNANRILTLSIAACIAAMVGCTVYRQPPRSEDIRTATKTNTQSITPDVTEEANNHIDVLGFATTVAPVASEKPSIGLSEVTHWPIRNVRGIAWSPASEMFVAAVTDEDGSGLRLYDTESGRRIWFTEETSSFGVTFDREGNTIASSLAPFVNGVRIWDSHTGQVLNTLRAQVCTAGEIIQYDPNRQWLLTATSVAAKGEVSDKAYVYVWNVKGSHCDKQIVVADYRLSSMTVTDDGQALILSLYRPPKSPNANGQHQVEIRNIVTDETLCVLQDQALPLKFKDNELITVDTGSWSTLRTWDISDCTPTGTVSGVDTPYSIAIMPEGNFVIIGRDTIRIWSFPNWELVFDSGLLPGDYVEGLYPSPNGRLLLAVVAQQAQADSSTLILWRVN
jgi:WD40 repeat protein